VTTRWVLLVYGVMGCSTAQVPHVRSSPVPAEVSASEPAHRYSRGAWRHWIDADHDCQDTRQEVLIAESDEPVEFADARHCKVKRGRWICPYTGRTVTDPAELDVDHLVPLENADRSGGWRWSAERKREYANDLVDPEQLVAVVASVNRAKGSKGPDAWLPPSQAALCGYVGAWLHIKRRWQLAIPPDEREAIERVRATCRR
jgi:hypothetical protein